MTAHPYMPNSTPELRRELLDAVGVDDVEELFVQIPPHHRLQRKLELPPAIPSEAALRRHLVDLLSRNESCEESLSFLGGGIWRHHVPAIVDEIARRSEFLTPVWGTPSSDLGRNQAWFEFASQLGELVGMEFVGLPVYSWGCAEGHAVRMAARLTGRDLVLVPRGISPERLAVIRTYAGAPELGNAIEVETVGIDHVTGALDLDDLRAKLSPRVAAVLFENPGYLGAIEPNAAEIASLARAAGAETIVGVDPISLGVIAPPAVYGADIVVGSVQPLGIHMSAGGGAGGFIATRDEPRYARQYPTLNLSIAETVAGEHAFAMTLFHQTSYGSREEGNDWTGNSVYLHAVANAAYMSLMGPEGFADLGRLILARSHYAAKRLGEIEGVEILFPRGFFKELVVSYEDTGRSVAGVHAKLRAHGIFGGIDLSQSHPELGESALVCVTEVHSRDDIDRFVDTVQEVVA
ncbi:MAG: aminomethyl-transferring glycine dehydrogenase subunit GcvPA [Actinobacteria bacterium]|nr:aminomethyl-transferring glycine dehydrogenase subunit GcvPA [Actinomycetota bacterium]